MKFIGKLLLYVLIALAVAILGLYFLLQTRLGARARQRLGFGEQQLPSGV